jgi:hypothetical protein
VTASLKVISTGGVRRQHVPAAAVRGMQQDAVRLNSQLAAGPALDHAARVVWRRVSMSPHV